MNVISQLEELSNKLYPCWIAAALPSCCRKFSSSCRSMLISTKRELRRMHKVRGIRRLSSFETKSCRASLSQQTFWTFQTCFPFWEGRFLSARKCARRARRSRSASISRIIFCLGLLRCCHRMVRAWCCSPTRPRAPQFSSNTLMGCRRRRKAQSRRVIPSSCRARQPPHTSCARTSASTTCWTGRRLWRATGRSGTNASWRWRTMSCLVL
mmetsp:Transcript_3482/g.7173  ORF Transcript_3482/g.7173 Transcript_3482/m.7173 type:complete len:211 (-) Transcript_3482:93-725(-)